MTPEALLPETVAGRWREAVIAVNRAGTWVGDRLYRHRRSPQRRWTLYVLLAGRLELVLAEARLLAAAPCAWLVRPDTPLSEAALETPVELFSAGLDFLPRTDDTHPLTRLPPMVALPLDDLPRWRRRIEEAAAGFHDFGWIDLPHALAARPAVEWMVMRHVAALCRQETSPPASGLPPVWLDTLVDRIITHGGRPMTMADLVRWSGVTPSHLCHCFRRHYRTSPMRFVIAHRLDLAARFLLSEPDRPVADIAARCGFPDRRRFWRSFKRRFGIAPQPYRHRRTATAGWDTVRRAKPAERQDETSPAAKD